MTWRMLTPFSSRSLSAATDPFLALHRELDRVLDDAARDVFPSVSGVSNLKLDVNEDDKGFTVTADIPGLSEKEVDVTFQNDTLTIRGEKKVERDEKQGTWHITERSSGSFARQLVIPSNVDADKIEAKFEKGVLTVSLPKQPDEKAGARKIEVKSS